jgi:hypothetical protein
MRFAFTEYIRFDHCSDARAAALICSSADERVSNQTAAPVRRCFRTTVIGWRVCNPQGRRMTTGAWFFPE